jgi:hypothetical protein
MGATTETPLADDWWKSYDDKSFQPLIALEAAALTITEYETTTIPGLLQTREYARAVILGYLPQIDHAVLQRRVEARLRRQDRLTTDHPPRLIVLLDESALHRHVGGPAEMSRQLHLLAAAAQRPNITVRVIPFEAGAHMGFDCAFRLMEFGPGADIPDTVFVEHQMGHYFWDKDEHLRRFREMIDHLSTLALSPERSVEMIEERAAALGGA